jgi:hypothetical protein
VAAATLAWADVDVTPVPDDDLPEARDVFIWVDVPPEVPDTQMLTTHVFIRNKREAEPYTLEDIDISDRYLEGFEVDTITPQPDSIDHSEGTMTLQYGLEIGPQRSAELFIVLRATKAGLFSGDLDVWSNDDNECATRRLQTEIVVEPQQ